MLLACGNNSVRPGPTLCPPRADGGRLLTVVPGSRSLPACGRGFLRNCARNSVLQPGSKQDASTPGSLDRISHMATPEDKGARKCTATLGQ